ncbi:MAG: SUMF1/EgtB/PvdO family nonheme iron enzyme [Planctomycetota bacterium]
MDENQIGLESADAFEASLEPDAPDLDNATRAEPVAKTKSDEQDSSHPLRLLESHEEMPRISEEPNSPPPEPKTSAPKRAKKHSEYERWIGKRLGHFRLLKVLGAGTMGVVFKAQHTTLERLTALKVLRRQVKGVDRQDRVERFLVEAQTAANIDHPSIAQVYEIAEHNGWWYIAMEYLEGGSLHEVIRATGPLAPNRASLMLLDAARGLEAAHEAGVIHRDIKPANLMLNRRGRCKLVDFGLVKLDTHDNPFGWDDKQVVGTPLYVAPEVALGKGAQLASDVYSLGTTLFAVLTGAPPYRAEDVKEILRKHVRAEIPDVREKNQMVPASLAELIKRTMAKDPEARPTAAALATALQLEVGTGHHTETPSSVMGPAGSGTMTTATNLGSSGTSFAAASGTGSSVPPADAPTVPATLHPTGPSKLLWTLAIAPGAIALIAGAIWFASAPAPSATPGTNSGPSAHTNPPTPIKPVPMTTNGIGMRLAQIPPGDFEMGSPPSEPGRNSDERTVLVELTRPFEISVTEITQSQWAEVMGADYRPPEGLHPNEEMGLRFVGDSFPAYVSWYEAAEFCRLLGLREGVLYRLPTEAEWEYACRAGGTGAFSLGDALSPAEANVDKPSDEKGTPAARRPMPVASFSANSWGLYDMHGNVMEWCADAYAPYQLGPLTDPTAPAGDTRVLRGGSWDSYARVARSANRWSNFPVIRTDSIGFRVVCIPGEPPDDGPSYLPERATTDTGTYQPPALPVEINRTVAIDPALPTYEPEYEVNMRVRSVGSDTMDRLIHLWEASFERWHDGVVFFHQGRGSGTAIPALAEGLSHLGPMSRALKPEESRLFQAEFGYTPTLATIGIDALAVYVHPANPIAESGLSFAKLDAILSTTRNRGFSHPVETWGDLGLSGEWAEAPIRVYGRNPASGTYGHFQRRVLDGGAYKTSNIELIGSAEVVEAVANDRFGIGYSSIGYDRPDAVAIALAEATGVTPAAPSPAAASDGRYPLARPLYVALDNTPNEPLDAAMREFMRFIYSKEGQRLVVDAGFFPLSNERAQAELRSLDIEP